jgi:hypothetical protein
MMVPAVRIFTEYRPLLVEFQQHVEVMKPKMIARVVILGVRRLTGRHNRRAGVPAHYTGREPGVLEGPVKIRVSIQESWFLIPWFLISGTLEDKSSQGSSMTY